MTMNVVVKICLRQYRNHRGEQVNIPDDDFSMNEHERDHVYKNFVILTFLYDHVTIHDRGENLNLNFTKEKCLLTIPGCSNG